MARSLITSSQEAEIATALQPWFTGSEQEALVSASDKTAKAAYDEAYDYVTALYGSTASAEQSAIEAAASAQSASDSADAAAASATLAQPGYIVQGSRRFKLIAGVLRPSDVDGTWYAIDDSNHSPLGVSSVTVSSQKLVVTFDETFGKIATFVVVPDEALAKMGFTCGASVQTNEARIELAAPLRFNVTFNGTTTADVEAPSYWGSKITATVSSSSGALTVGHTQITILQNNVNPTLTMLEGSDSLIAAVDESSRGNFVAYVVGPIATRIHYDGSAWVSEDADGPPLSLFFNSTDGLAVQYGSDPSTDVKWGAQVSAYGDSVLNPYIKQQTTTKVCVKFKNDAGTIDTTAGTDMDFQLLVPGRFRRKVPTGKIAVDRGYARVDPADMDATFLDQNSANLWFIALMEVTA